MAGMAGLEPTISESKSGVLPLHYIPPSTCAERPALPASRISGVGDGARTHDTRNHNPVLIPTELHPPFSEPALARQEGLEPPAYCLEGSCSILLSYWRLFSRQLAPAPGFPRTRPQALLYYHHIRLLSSILRAFFPAFALLLTYADNRAKLVFESGICQK